MNRLEVRSGSFKHGAAVPVPGAKRVATRLGWQLPEDSIAADAYSSYLTLSVRPPMMGLPDDPLANLRLPAAALTPDPVFEDLAKANLLPGRLQLYTKGTAVSRGLIGPGEFGIPESDERITGLGERVDILPLARKAKAIDMSSVEAIVTSCDATSKVFKEIQRRANHTDSGCMYGVSFLVCERKTGRFLEFYCGTRSTRPLAEEIYPFLPLVQRQIDARAERGEDVTELRPHGPIPLMLKAKLQKQGKFNWHVPVRGARAKPFAVAPTVEVVEEGIAKFLLPNLAQS
jgi:hypothetical protein